jgi:hypothetical protein
MYQALDLLERCWHRVNRLEYPHRGHGARVAHQLQGYGHAAARKLLPGFLVMLLEDAAEITPKCLLHACCRNLFRVPYAVAPEEILRMARLEGGKDGDALARRRGHDQILKKRCPRSAKPDNPDGVHRTAFAGTCEEAGVAQLLDLLADLFH